MFRFIETIQLKDGKFLNPVLHQNRLSKTFHHFFPGKPVPEIHTVLENSCMPSSGKYKCTLTYSEQIEGINIRKYIPKKITRLICREANDLDYSFKYSDRSCFEFLRNDLSYGEELIIIQNGNVTDTSYANLIFFDGSEWNTPATALLEGTKRAKLIREGKVKMVDISVHEIHKYEKCSLINAMLDPADIEIDIGDIITSEVLPPSRGRS